MYLDFAPRLLTWDEVDPARHPFDAAAAAAVVRGLEPARRVPERSGEVFDEQFDHKAELWADAMSYALVERYGRWAVGWRWAHDEGDFDGGPVGSWYNPQESVTTPEETLDRVAEALCEWRGWLETLAGWFEAQPVDPGAADAGEGRIRWERAARNLILQVGDRTGNGNIWQTHCTQVLTWFLTRWHVAPDVARELVDEAVGGRFESWVAPDPGVVDDVAGQLAAVPRPFARPPASGGAPLPDDLQRWLGIRETVPWQDVTEGGGDGPVVPVRDGAAEDIRAFDGAIDPARAEGLLAALELVRSDAARGAPLKFPLLARWQQHVLGVLVPPPFRTLPAFAKGGRERYHIGPDTRARLDACLVEAGGPAPGLTGRAARAYLDVCFFHPFEDGNARCAFLALVFVLAREGVALDRVSLLRRVSLRAGSVPDALSLARFVGIHLDGTRASADARGRREP